MKMKIKFRKVVNVLKNNLRRNFANGISVRKDCVGVYLQIVAKNSISVNNHISLLCNSATCVDSSVTRNSFRLCYGRRM